MSVSAAGTLPVGLFDRDTPGPGHPKGSPKRLGLSTYPGPGRFVSGLPSPTYPCACTGEPVLFYRHYDERKDVVDTPSLRTWMRFVGVYRSRVDRVLGARGGFRVKGRALSSTEIGTVVATNPDPGPPRLPTSGQQEGLRLLSLKVRDDL